VNGRGRVLTMARDAGAGTALAPVVRAFIRDGVLTVSTVAAGKAAPVFERHGLPVLAFPELPDETQVAALLERERPDVVLTGTSFKPDRDVLFWRAGAARGVPTVALVDHWVNYLERFSIERPFDALPDVVAVMDDVTAQRLCDLGCPAERVRVTGQPYFDQLAAEGAAVGRDEARRELGIDPDRIVVVFASEPQARYCGASSDDPGYLGYTEHDVVALLRRALAEVARDAILIVKLHPLEDPDAFHELADMTGVPAIRVLRTYPPAHLISAADVVVGMTSVFQLESAVMGVPTLSLRPGGREDEFFLEVHRGLIETVLDPANAAPALRRALDRAPLALDAPRPSFGEGAIERLSALVYELAADVPREVVRAR
jgi:hypothetical protein